MSHPHLLAQLLGLPGAHRVYPQAVPSLHLQTPSEPSSVAPIQAWAVVSVDRKALVSLGRGHLDCSKNLAFEDNLWSQITDN